MSSGDAFDSTGLLESIALLRQADAFLQDMWVRTVDNVSDGQLTAIPDLIFGLVQDPRQAQSWSELDS